MAELPAIALVHCPILSFLLHSIHVLLSIAFVHFPCLNVCTSRPLLRRSDPTLPPFDIYCISPLPILTTDVVIVIKMPLRQYLTHTYNVFSCDTL